MPRPLKISPGDRFHDWVVIEEVQRRVFANNHSCRYFRCRCAACGVTEKEIQLNTLRSGISKRCVHCSSRQRAIRLKIHQPMMVRGLLVQLEEIPDHLLEELMEGATKEFRRRCEQ